MDQNNVLESGGFYFIYNFDSGNLGHVERVPTELIAPSVTSQKNVPAETPDYEFNLWTRPDCAGTEFENGNRTWFYFGVQASEPNVLVRLNLINLNKQGKMYAQGMAPVTRTLPGKPQWERIRDRPVHNTDDNAFTLSFKYRTCENTKATTFFAFTYPFSFAELQIALNSIDMKMLPVPPPQSPDDIYYHRECLIYSLEGRRVDLLTISSHHGLSTEREERLKNLFPEKQERPFKFPNKKVIFVSARVHPGETPSSFVFNGFLNLLLNRNDPIAIQLRKVYVFKMIPFLNPDGVARGHYRTDTRGVNLNRVYLNPSLTLHPTVYASRALIRFYHYGCEKEDSFDDAKSYTSRSIQNISESAEKKRGQSSNLKRDKAKFAAGNKSSTTLCQPSDNSKRNSSYKLRGEAGALVEQVYDMSIRESAACEDHQASIRDERRADDGSSLLTEQLLRSCLGSGVRLSASGELDAHGPSPLRPLRDTLKNSISLLMGSTSSVGGDSLNEKESRLSNVRMGWCAQCRAAIARLEQAAPPAPPAQPAPHSPRSQTAMREGQEHTYSSIDEYREYQKKQFEEAMVLSSEAGAAREEGAVYFCTNCFKRYTIAPNNEEISCDTVPAAGGVAVSAGDSGCIRCEPHPALTNVSTGDTLPPLPSKDEKPKQKIAKKKSPPMPKPAPPSLAPSKETDSGLYLYLDLHGHASKKGIFMYGNHFDDVESCVECMLLPRVMSLNNLHFHFSSCNFTERNMYLKDRRDGMSREGSGRVAVLKATGLVRSYTLECNYNTGRLVNVLPPTVRDGPAGCQLSSSAPMPPKYTPHIFEETPSIATGENTSLAPIMASSKTNSIQTTDTANSNVNTSLIKKTLSHQNKIGRAVTNFPRNTTRPMSAGSRTNSYKEKTLDRHRQFNNSNSKNTSRPQSATSKTNNNPVNFTSIEKAWDPEKRLRAPDQNSSVRTRSSTLGAHSSNASYNTLMEKVRYVRPRYSQNLNLSLEFLEEINPMEVGRSLGASILDLTGQHPNSRIPCSEHRNITSVREWLRAHTKTMRPQITMPRIRPKTASPPRQPLYPRKGKVDERKENAYRADIERPRAAPAPAAPLAPRGNRSPDEPKRSLAAKRRNVLGIRKPHASKTHVPAKPRRAAPDASVARLGKRAFRPPRPRAIASSSSSSADAHWEEVAGGTALQALPPRRRPASNPPHPKKIRLKASL